MLTGSNVQQKLSFDSTFFVSPKPSSTLSVTVVTENGSSNSFNLQSRELRPRRKPSWPPNSRNHSRQNSCRPRKRLAELSYLEEEPPKVLLLADFLPELLRLSLLFLPPLNALHPPFTPVYLPNQYHPEETILRVVAKPFSSIFVLCFSHSLPFALIPSHSLYLFVFRIYLELALCNRSISAVFRNFNHCYRRLQVGFNSRILEAALGFRLSHVLWPLKRFSQEVVSTYELFSYVAVLIPRLLLPFLLLSSFPRSNLQTLAPTSRPAPTRPIRPQEYGSSSRDSSPTPGSRRDGSNYSRSDQTIEWKRVFQLERGSATR